MCEHHDGIILCVRTICSVIQAGQTKMIEELMVSILEKGMNLINEYYRRIK